MFVINSYSQFNESEAEECEKVVQLHQYTDKTPPKQ